MNKKPDINGSVLLWESRGAVNGPFKPFNSCMVAQVTSSLVILVIFLLNPQCRVDFQLPHVITRGYSGKVT